MKLTNQHKAIIGLWYWVLFHPALMWALWTLAVVPLMATGRALDSYLAFIVLVFMVRATIPAPNVKQTNLIVIGAEDGDEKES